MSSTLRAASQRGSRSGSSLARWWQGYVRRRDSARLARYKAAHQPRLQGAAKAALGLHAALYLVLLLAVLSGCSAVKGVTITEDERKACEASGCTVWTKAELDALVRHFFKKGYEAGVKSL
jgi:hypothetical protein